MTRSGHEIAGKKALAQAGWNIKDVRSFHPYDDFLIALVIQFEAFGFCKPGEGMAFVRDTDLSYNGTLPMNTGGGQISAGQAACSSHNLIEAVRQLMGEGGKRQVKDTDQRARDRHRLDQLRAQLGHERRAGAGPERIDVRGHHGHHIERYARRQARRSSTSTFGSRSGRRRGRRSSSSSTARSPRSISTSRGRSASSPGAAATSNGARCRARARCISYTIAHRGPPAVPGRRALCGRQRHARRRRQRHRQHGQLHRPMS